MDFTTVVREMQDGTVVIEYKGSALPARAFAKDARVTQAAIADNKILGPMLAEARAVSEYVISLFQT